MMGILNNKPRVITDAADKAHSFSFLGMGTSFTSLSISEKMMNNEKNHLTFSVGLI